MRLRPATVTTAKVSRTSRGPWGEWLAAAADQSKAELGQLLARRFPRPEMPAWVQAVPPAPSPALPTDQLSPGTVEGVTEPHARRAGAGGAG